MIGKKTDENFVVVAVDDPFKVRATYLNLTQKIPSPAEIAASAKKAAGAKVSAGVDLGGKRIKKLIFSMSIDGSPFLLGRAVFVAGQGG